MSNHSHLHENEAGQSVDAFGTRDECDVCRAKAGLPSMEQVKAGLSARGVDASQFKGGAEPAEQLLADLEAAEETIDELRATLKNAYPELAQERDAALAANGELTRQLHTVEQQLQAEREKVASLEQSLASVKPKK